MSAIRIFIIQLQRRRERLVAGPAARALDGLQPPAAGATAAGLGDRGQEEQPLANRRGEH